MAMWLCDQFNTILIVLEPFWGNLGMMFASFLINSFWIILESFWNMFVAFCDNFEITWGSLFDHFGDHVGTILKGFGDPFPIIVEPYIAIYNRNMAIFSTFVHRPGFPHIPIRFLIS